MTPQEKDKLIGEFMGLTFHENIEVTGYSDTTEPYVINETISAWSVHKVLEYKESDCPGHWNENDIVDEWETPLIKKLLYSKSWEELHLVIDKIESISDNTWVVIMGKGCWIETGGEEICIHCSQESSPLTKFECTYKCVVEFIQWYNRLYSKNSIIELTMNEFKEKYSESEFTKIAKLWRHDLIPDTPVTLSAEFILEGNCQSSTCSNCSGVECCLIKIKL